MTPISAAERNKQYADAADRALAAQVRAVIKANAYANDMWPILTEIFRPFVGKQVHTQSGALLAKIEKLMPEFPNTTTLRVYRHHSTYSLGWTVNTRECSRGPDGFGDIASYHETTMPIGDLSGGILTALANFSEPPNWRTDYTAEGVIEARAMAEQKKHEYEKAAGDCYPFGER